MNVRQPFIQVPIVDGTYVLTPEQALIDQALHEPEICSYPRWLPTVIKQTYACLVEDMRAQIFFD